METIETKGENTTRMKRKRANETEEETMDRKGENTARMKRRPASK